MSDPVVTLWLTAILLWFIQTGRLWEIINYITKLEKTAGIPAGTGSVKVDAPAPSTANPTNNNPVIKTVKTVQA
jgi:hypothetical protein